MNLFLTLGNQLFDPRYLKDIPKDKTVFFMREDQELASYFRFHQQKIAFFFSAMRTYSEELRKNQFQVHYEEWTPVQIPTFNQSLSEFIKSKKIQRISCFEIEDKFFEKRVLALAKDLKLEIDFLESPMFLTSRAQFREYLGSKKKPFMKTFYESQRRRLKILVTEDNQPVGGQWSFDSENRLALPKDHRPPEVEISSLSPITESVFKVVEKYFSHHPGVAHELWLPTDRSGARRWLLRFLEDRLEQFGPFEDALPSHSEFVYHSVLTPFLNIGLLTPRQVIAETMKSAQKNKIPLASLEGFVRQIIGWREFIRGIYQNFSDQQETTNFWNHKNKLKEIWYQGSSGIPPLDRAIEKCLRRGYNHHIERLMVIGSLMLLLEVDPQEAHRWFMEMYIDSSDWVMGPNVYGMALFSDGGIFATKPYICGSNYLRKMSGDKKGDWCDGVDGLYWMFIRKHRSFFSRNPRLNMITKNLDKMSPEKWQILERSAQDLRDRLVEVIP